MGPVIKLLQAIRGLTKSGAIKSLDDAYRLAQRELGEKFSRYKNQIKDAFDAGNTKPSNVISFKKKEGIESLSKGKVKKPGEVLDVSFKPGVDKRGKRVEESPSQASGISPVMQRLEKGIETLKTMKQPGMDLTVGLTRTAVRKILDKSGIKVPEKIDPIEVFEKNFGGDALIDVKDVAEEMIELERMGKSTKSMDEILEQSGMFDIKINPDAPKGMSDEQIEQIKKEVDQEKQLKDFDPTDREPNAEGGLNSLMASDDMNERLLEKLYEDFLDQGLSPEEAKRAAEEAFRERAAYGGMMRNNFAVGSLPKGIQALVKTINKKFGKGAMKTADEIDQPPKTDRQIISEFEARNPDPKRQMTDSEYEDFVEEVGGGDQLEAYSFDGTIGDAQRILKEQENYMKYMYDQYKTGKLDPVAGDKSPARKKFLQQKFDEMESSGDPKLMTRDEIEELTFFDMGTEMDEAAKKASKIDDDIDISQGMIDLDEMNFTKNAKAAKEYLDNASVNKEIKEGVTDVLSDTSPAGLEKSLEVDDLMLKYPGINRDLAKQIANDPDPQRKAEAIATIDQAFELMRQGKSQEEVYDIMKQMTDRTKQANGGLSYLMGM